MIRYELTHEDEDNLAAGFMAITLWALILCSVVGNLGFRDAGIFIAHLGLWSWFVMVFCLLGGFYMQCKREQYENEQPHSTGTEFQEDYLR